MHHDDQVPGHLCENHAQYFCDLNQELSLWVVIDFLFSLLIFRNEEIIENEYKGDDGDFSHFENIKRPSVTKHNIRLEEEVAAYDPQTEELEKQKQMSEIYGESWEKVLSTETSLQLNFNRFCDKELPEEWPCIPLNLKFN